MTRLLAIRGAITVEADDPSLIAEATRELIDAIMAANALAADDIVSAIFTLTDDLRSAFPATAARDHGWITVPMLCTVEIPVPGSLPRCLRAMIHIQSDRPADAIRHVYLRRARGLRPNVVND